MSKELTEKWRNGTLEIGWYFIRIKDGRCVKDYFKKDFEVFFDTYIKEVLAPVPTYKEFFEDKKFMKDLGRDYSELMNQKVELLEKIEALEKENAELLEKIEEFKVKIEKK